MADVPGRASQAQSYERRWQRFCANARIRVNVLYLLLVMVALQGWQNHRLYLALDTTMLWKRYCMIQLSIVFEASRLRSTTALERSYLVAAMP